MVYLLAFIAGALCTPLIPASSLGSPAVLLFAAALSGACALAARRLTSTRGRGITSGCWSIACLAVGAAVALMSMNHLLDARLDEKWHGKDVQFHGRIEEVIDQTDDFSRVLFRVKKVESGSLLPDLNSRLLRLSWYYGPQLEVGQNWAVTARLKRPRGFVNPRSFDYAAWLLSQEIMATGYIKEGVRQQRASATWSGLEQLRKTLPQRLFDGQPQSQPFFRALLLGDMGQISADQWRVLQRTGTIHLMAISGLHVGLVAAIGYFVGWLLVRGLACVGLTRGNLWLSRLLPPIAASGLAFGYSALAGFSIPTQRAMVVVALANLALLMGAKMNPLRLLALACILVLLTSPLAPTQTGFWLSFVAVLVLIVGFGGRVERLHPVSSLIRAQWLLAVGLVGPLLGVGQIISVVGPVANLIAVPLVSVFIVPGLLLAALFSLISPLLAGGIIHLLDKLFALLWQYLSLLSDATLALWWPAFPTTSGLIAVAACGSLFVLLPRGLYTRWLGVFLLGLALLAPRPPDPSLRISVVDVGQGLAVWVHTPGYNLLYDTGPVFSADFDAGSRIVVPYLRTQGVHRLDTLIVSHGDNDHSGGLAGVLGNMPVEQLWLGDPIAPFSRGKPCVQGQLWQRGDVRFEMLWPPPQSAYTDNNNSCVLLLKLGQHNILLTGDIEKEVERRLLAEGRVPDKLTLVIAPHHGSKTSSSEGFVSSTQAQAVVFSAGYQSRFGHPHPDVVERYRRVDAQQFNTGEQGAISFQWDSPESEFRVETARATIDRAWY